ncbi:hypothetical protein BH10PSE13_BH10PSE13_10540 [soil metagenome]
MTLDEMLAREAIRCTIAIYNNAGDRGAMDEMVGRFTPDATLVVLSDELQGREAIRAYFQNIMDTGFLTGSDRRPARHHVASSRVTFDSPDSAQGWSYFSLLRGGEIIQSGLYIDRFVRVGDDWLLASRRVKVEHDALRGPTA